MKSIDKDVLRVVSGNGRMTFKQLLSKLKKKRPGLKEPQLVNSLRRLQGEGLVVFNEETVSLVTSGNGGNKKKRPFSGRKKEKHFCNNNPNY